MRERAGCGPCPRRGRVGGSDVHAIRAVDRFQRRHRWAGLPLSVVYKYMDDQGGFLAALITYYGFLSLFPALLLLVTSAGYILAGNPELQRHLIESAVGQFPLLGTYLQQNVSALQGSPIAAVVGCLGLLYAALGIGQATQLAFNR